MICRIHKLIFHRTHKHTLCTHTCIALYAVEVQFSTFASNVLLCHPFLLMSNFYMNCALQAIMRFCMCECVRLCECVFVCIWVVHMRTLYACAFYNNKAYAKRILYRFIHSKDSGSLFIYNKNAAGSEPQPQQREIGTHIKCERVTCIRDAYAHALYPGPGKTF